MYRIIYPNTNDSINIIIPAEDNINLHDLAKSVVPVGVPYKIIAISDLPNDRTFRSAWIYNFDNYDGYGEYDDIN